MATSNQEIIIFTEIQKKLFYMIPEKWDAIYLYASFLEEPRKKPVGEMYFYYVPKGILKRKPVNVYQIPGMFNIDEEAYNGLIQRLFIDIRKLREFHRKVRPNLWSNFTITIENAQFKIEYGHEELGNNGEFNPYERHIIWRYKYLGKKNIDLMSRDEKNIIARYLNSSLIQLEQDNRDVYVEGMYRMQERNIIDYEKILTIEAALALQEQQRMQQEKMNRQVASKKKDDRKNKKNKIHEDVGRHGNIEPQVMSQQNQDLFNKVEKMKSVQSGNNDDFDDDMILSSDFMTRKD